MKKLIIMFLLSIPLISNSQVTFTEIPTSILEVKSSSIDFSDIDSDGDQDLLITGSGGSSWGNTVLYENISGIFYPISGTPFDSVGVSDGYVVFGDVDNDGDEDLLLAGDSMGQNTITKLYINDGGDFYLRPTPIFAAGNACIVLSDMDNDNYLDVLISGSTTFSNTRTELYLNDGNGYFTAEVPNTGLIDVNYPCIAVSDIDGDGYNDVLISGDDNSGSPFSCLTKLYINDGLLNFTEVIGTPFPEVSVRSSSNAFSDIDNDGDPDLLITGNECIGGGSFVSVLYENNGGVFTEIPGIPFVQVYGSSVAFSDVNGDGYADVLITGEDTTANDVSKLYINDGSGGFDELLQDPFFELYDGDVAFADIDNDGNNDVLLTGGNYNAKLYLNNGVNSTAITEISIVKCEAFPNPSRGVFNVEFTSFVRQDLEVRIINSIGEIVYIDNINNHLGEYNNSINLEEHSKGVYLLELDTDNEIISKKLILQ